MSLDHGSSVPLYVQLANVIRGQIQDGTLTGRLPSVRSYCEQYGVSHITVKAALAILRAEGLVHSRVGKGTYTGKAP